MHFDLEFNYRVLLVLIEITALAVLASVIQASIVWLLTKKVKQQALFYIAFAALLPFLSVLWAFMIFEFQATVNKKYLARDPLIGEICQTPLVGRYRIFMCDQTACASVGTGQYEASLPETNYASAQGWRPVFYGVESVKDLQVMDNYLIGAIDSAAIKSVDNQGGKDCFFVLDTKSNLVKKFRTTAELKGALAKLSCNEALNLEPVLAIYRKHRFTTFDYFAALLLILPPLAVLYRFWCMVLNTQKQKG